MILFYLLVTVMPLVKHPLWSRFVGDLTMTKYVGAACVVYAIFHLAGRTSLPEAFRSPLVKLFGAFYLLAVFSYFTKSLPSAWQLSPMLSYSSFLFLFFVTAAVVDSLPRLRNTLLAAIGSLGVASLYVIREWQKYHSVLADIRPGWVIGDSNYYTLSAVLCIPLAYYLARQNRPAWERLGLYGCLLITLFGVMLAASRGGFLGLIVAFVFVAWHSGNRLRWAALAGLVIIPVLILAPNAPMKRLLHPNFSDQDATEQRIVAWRAGLRMIEAHPLLGIGLGNFKPFILQYEQDGDERVDTIAHNTYVEVAAEMGIPGLLLFLGILFTCMRLLHRVYTYAPDSQPLLRDAALGLQAGLWGAVVGIFFLSCETQRLLWLILFLVPCVYSLAAEAEEREEDEDSLSAPDALLEAEGPEPASTNENGEWEMPQWA